MSIKLQLPRLSELKPRITVIGVGGAGGNALNNMIATGLTGVEFVAANTDAQALATSSAEHRIQLGINLTEGLGAGSKPEIGEAAAEEAIDDLKSQISGSHMCFIAAGMGGGTGTGAAAVVARVAKDLGVLTVAVVTKPFQFEGSRRMRMAEVGIAELAKYVDTLIVIPNQNLFRIATEKTTFAEAFKLADQVLHSGIACIVDLIVREGLINLDFADVRTVMKDMGTAMMGTGEGSGERRAVEAAEAAIQNPLLDDISLRGAKGLLLSIIGSHDLTLYEVDEAASRVRQEVDPEANIIVGATFDESLQGRVRVSIVASGLARAGEGAVRQREAAGAAARTAAAEPPSPTVAASTPPLAQETEPRRNPMRQADPRRLEPVRDLSPPPFQTRRPAEEEPLELDAMHEVGSEHDPWRAPGDVTIVEQPAYVPHGLGNQRAAAYEPREPGPGFFQGMPAPEPPPPPPFRPAPPAEVRQPARRMPQLEDFPAVAQREFQAKAPPPPLPPLPPPAEQFAADAEPSGSGREGERRRVGFFERWSGGKSRKGEEAGQAGSDGGRRSPTLRTPASPAQTGNVAREAGSGSRAPASQPTRPGTGRSNTNR